ncbi:MAG: hypothetical protein IPK94_03200 [Saprospiraceae bacterium]|jgi:hypothetical protein|nr:hypothetical protein [Saprospiraceae bacterium]MBK8279184.1 hypothetical protein [Saprospiraceae bacterium]MBK8511611.1 hypothetical protein [Saprospiraceae bacterium]
MKNILIIVIAMASFSWMACEKSSNTENATGITGTWNLVAVSGGITGQGYAAKFDAIRFDDTSFDLLKNKASIYNGAYILQPNAVTPDSLKITSAPTDADFFLNITAKGIVIDKNKLVLTEPCCDLYSYEFSRTVN